MHESARDAFLDLLSFLPDWTGMVCLHVEVFASVHVTWFILLRCIVQLLGDRVGALEF